MNEKISRIFFAKKNHQKHSNLSMKTFQCQFQVFELNSAKQTGDITHPNVRKEFVLIMFYFKAIIAYVDIMFIKKLHGQTRKLMKKSK